MRHSAFDLDAFVADCQSALTEHSPARAARETLLRALADPSSVMKTLGEPAKAGVTPLYHSDTLTVLNVIWGPRMTLMPHNHEMWAVIGIYTGREDNIFWRRIKEEKNGKIEAAGADTIADKEALQLGRDIIHSVTNPVDRLTGAIHIYGGDFFGTPRSEWEPETLTEQPYDVDKNMQLFEQWNRMLQPA
ncbi:MAG: hypothetical protein R3316_10795 [Rhodovibrionaceae bacterium]|nr:hypothetical protein [Rhodovibrionaceae bacterium]